MTRVGKWRVKWSTLVLEHDDGHGYEVDLEDCTTCAQVLDWIFHLRDKTWLTSTDIGDLVEILRLVLDPCRNLCSWGADKGPWNIGDHWQEVKRRLDTTGATIPR
jgi:hypothetical protein